MKNTHSNHLFLLSIWLLLTATALSGCVHYQGDNHISSLPFRDLEIFDTDTRYKNAGLEDNEAIYLLPWGTAIPR